MSDAVDPPDRELVRRLQGGDHQALYLLVERYRGPLHGYLRRLVDSPQDAEDLFQDTFLRVVRAADRFDPARPFRPWLYTIASNLVKNLYRSRGYRQAASLDQTGEDDGDPLAARLQGDARNPLAAAALGEDRARVRAAVSKLPLKGRQALVLYYFEGLSYEDVAQTLEIPKGTVKSRIHNAMARLSELLHHPDTA